MAEKLQKLWVEKYRPKYIDEYVFQNSHDQKLLLTFIRDREIPNLLLSGVQGSGKTTLAKIVVNELDIDPLDVMTINASDYTGVDNVRKRIRGFAETLPNGKFKLVNLEEADYLSKEAQAALRNLTEEYSDTVRYIFTCNYPHKIIPALHSRFQHFQFKSFPQEEIFERVEYILANEKVKFEKSLVDLYVSVGYPDLRKIINLVQQHTFNGVLTAPTQTDKEEDYKIELLVMLETDNWAKIREMLCAQVSDNEWDDVYRFLYENLHKSPKFSMQNKWEEGILVISGALYKHAIVADPEINFAECIIRLSRL